MSNESIEQLKQRVSELVKAKYPPALHDHLLNTMMNPPADMAGDPAHWKAVIQSMDPSSAPKQDVQRRENDTYVYYYTESANSIEIEHYDGPDADVRIPSHIDGVPVTAIGRFAHKKPFTSVTIPDTVVTIKESAFSRSGLKSITIPGSVKTIGEGAFYACEQLASAVIGGGVERIEQDAFAHCGELASVVMPDSVKAIGEGAFADCKLTELAIPDGVETIGEQAFRNSHISKLTIGSGVKTIEREAFAENLLEEAFIPNNVTAIGRGIFARNEKLRLAVIPDSFPVEKSRDDHQTMIGGGHIMTNATYNWEKANPQFAPSQWFDWARKGGGVIIKFYEGDDPELRIPSHIHGFPVVDIARGIDRKPFTSVVIPNTFKHIESRWFSGYALTGVTIPEGVVSIGKQAFSGNKLTGVAIPSSVTAIEELAFYENKLASVTIPGGVTSIGRSVFAENELARVEIPGSLAAIEESAFAANRLTSVVIPGSVATIGERAFGDNQLTSVTIGANVALGGKDDTAFDNNFDAFYNRQGRRAGTYVFDNGAWSRG